MRIAVYASTQLLRAGLEEVFTHTAGVTDAITAGTRTEFIDRCADVKPDVAVLEIGSSTEDAITDLRRMLPACRLIGISTDRQTDHEIRELRAAGLHDVASIRDGVATLLNQLQTDDGTEGGSPSRERPTQPTPVPTPTQDATLTRREVDVLAHVSAGFTAVEIADCLGVAPKTVENHKQRIYSKLEVHNQTHAVSIALQRGILDRTYTRGGPTARSQRSA
jgi:DNA-binding NarL/FixJ family response regulator